MGEWRRRWVEVVLNTQEWLDAAKQASHASQDVRQRQVRACRTWQLPQQPMVA